MSKTCLEGSSKNMLTKIECLPCAQSSSSSRLLHCSRCGKLWCGECFLDAMHSMKDRSPFQDATYLTYKMICSDGKGGSRADCEALFCEVISASTPDMYVKCNTCNKKSCYACIDQVELRQIARETVTRAVVRGKYKMDYHW